MSMRFEITEVKRPVDTSANAELRWEPAGTRLPGGPRVFSHAPSAVLARDQASRFFLVSPDFVKLTLLKDDLSHPGVLLVEGDMGTMTVEVIGAEPPKAKPLPRGTVQWPRVSPFRSGFESIVVRSRDWSDDMLRGALGRLLFDHRARTRAVAPKKKSRR